MYVCQREGESRVSHRVHLATSCLFYFSCLFLSCHPCHLSLLLVQFTLDTLEALINVMHVPLVYPVASCRLVILQATS